MTVTDTRAVHDLALRHYSTEKVVFDPAWDYSGRHDRGDKPEGFWVSVAGPDDWREWCEGERFRLDALANEHTVTLAPQARILHIDNLGDLEDLTYKYPAPVKEWRRSSVWADDKYPDWAAIATEWDGIIVAPYQWRARLDLFWYCTWDCASGCIWNLDAIESVARTDR